MDEMVTTNGQAVTITGNLPNSKIRISHLGSRSNGCRTSVDGVHAIRIHVIRQTRRTSDTGNHRNFMGRYSQFGQSLVKRIQESVVAAARTPARLSGFVICCRIFCFTHCYSSRIFIDESLKKLTESLYQLFHYERLAFYLIELMQVNTFHFHAEIACQLSHILFGHHDGLVFP